MVYSYPLVAGCARARLGRSLSLQERAGLGGARLELLHPRDDSALYHSIPELPGTPTLARPRLPPPPPPSTHPLLQPFNSAELSRINSVIRSQHQQEEEGEEECSGSEFSEDEFDPEPALAAGYENVSALERPRPEGAEAGSEYDVPELVELDTSFCSSTCLADISADSLMVPGPRLIDTEHDFDRDSIDGLPAEAAARAGPVIQTHGGKTVILSPAVARDQAEAADLQSKVFISSSSWINVTSCGEGEGEDGAQLTQQPQEPVKPPRLKKLARQQSKQELLRAKGFGSAAASAAPQLLGDTARRAIKGVNNNNNSSSKSRPEISSPVLINSTFNSEDYQRHKCITINRSDIPFLLHAMAGMEAAESEAGSVASTDTSLYTLDTDPYSPGEAAAAAEDIYSEHIYEEIPDPGARLRPLPPIPEGSAGSNTSKSIFTGATKYEILHYLNDAKQRIEGNVADFEAVAEDTERDAEIPSFLGSRHHKHRVSAGSNLSDSSSSSADSGGSGDGAVLWRAPGRAADKAAAVERHDSGVGSDSGLSGSGTKAGAGAGEAETEGEAAAGCEDCEVSLAEDQQEAGLCSKCVKRRGERKEIITEIVDTEVKYGRDLRIIVEEFYRPMLVAGLLSSDQLASIFLNVEQLIQVNTSFTEKLKQALDAAAAVSDEDLFSVQIGILFINAMPMLQAFEAYCTKQVLRLLKSIQCIKDLSV